MVGIAPFTWMVTSPLVGYLVSVINNMPKTNWHTARYHWLLFMITMIVVVVVVVLLQLPKLGLKFSLSIGTATVGVAYIAME